MPTSENMYRITMFFLALFMSINLFSQDRFIKLEHAKTQEPSYIFNKNIIGSENLINSLGSSKEEQQKLIEEIYVLVDKPNRNLNDYYNLTEYGLLFIDLKEGIDSKTQIELNAFFGIDKDADIYIDGYLLENKKYRIALAGVVEVEVIVPDAENGLQSKILNIWTLRKNERYKDEVKSDK